jgi:hypothetical protein
MGDHVRYVRMLKVFVTVSFILAIAMATTNSIAAGQVSEVFGSVDSGFLSKTDEPIVSALDYLVSCQNDDGGFGPLPESETDLKTTEMATISLASIGENPADYVANGKSPLDYLVEKQDELSNLSNVEAQVGRHVVAIVAAGLNPQDVNGRNYVEILKGYCAPGGEIGKENYIWDDAWVLMGLAACNQSGSDEVKRVLDHLNGLQTKKGAWSWNGGSSGEDPDTTSAILCALLCAGENSSSDAVSKSLQYLHSEQNQDGGFSTLGSNAATDAWAIMAINAAGQNPREWKVGKADPFSHLLSLQKDDGSIWWKSDSAGMSFEWTANGIIALTGGRIPPVISC